MLPAENAGPCLLVTGAGGRIGRSLRVIWGEKLGGRMQILWQTRKSGGLDGFCWDIGQNPPPDLPVGLIVLHLAGKISGSPDMLAQNATITGQVCAAARAVEAAHVFVMSSAAVYAPGPLPLTEDAAPAPVNPYGTSKLEAEGMAARVLAGRATGLTLLRLANLAGADALLGNAVPGKTVTLDPIEGQAGGPERSYIGPRVLARVLADLIQRAAEGAALPEVINVAQQPPVAMAALLQVLGQDWCFGPPRPGAVARVVLDTGRLEGLTELPQTSPAALIADMSSVPGWP